MPRLSRENPEVQAAIFNHDYPIVRLKKYRNGLEIIREGKTEIAKNSGGKRGKVKILSSQSLKRLAFTVITSQVEFRSIITLTYGAIHPLNGSISKGHLSTFLGEMRRIFGLFSYCWFLEFQKRGVPHYHILTDLEEPSTEQREAMAYTWVHAQTEMLYFHGNFTKSRREEESNKVFKVHSHKKAWEKIRKADGAKFYVVKYASKKEQKRVPPKYSDTGRFWATSRDVPSKDFQEVDVTEEELRSYLASKGLCVTNQLILPKLIIDLK